MLILEKQIKRGIELGIVKFVADPTIESGTVCQIGDDWLHFNGVIEENPEEYLKNTYEEDNVRMVAEVLLELREMFPDKYEYFMSFLNDLPINEDNETCLEFKCPLVSECSHYHGIHYNIWGEGIGTKEGCPRWDSNELPF